MTHESKYLSPHAHPDSTPPPGRSVRSLSPAFIHFFKLTMPRRVHASISQPDSKDPENQQRRKAERTEDSGTGFQTILIHTGTRAPAEG